MRKSRITAAALLVLGLLATMISSATLAQASPAPTKGAATLDQGKARTQPTRPQSDCGRAKRELVERAKRGDTRGVMCQESRPPTKALVAAAKKLRDVLPVPQWCVDRADTGWRFWHRRLACRYLSNRTIGLLRYVDGEFVEVGRIWYIQADMVHISPNSPTFEHQQSIGAFALEGEAAEGETVSGGFSCVGWCTYGAQNYPKQPLTRNANVEGERVFGTTATAVGAVGNITTRLDVVFGKPGFTNSEYSVSGPQVRCDNALPGINSPGCVFPQFIPTMDYSLTGPFSQLAAHIKKAQESGLPSVLNRLRDPANKSKNNTRACPRRYPRPENHDCDEYPFQSTEQGAWTANPDPNKNPAAWPARSFEGCRINEPNRTGPDGYSVCMIDRKQNQEGGNRLNTVLYVPERVIGGDAFNVEILP